jgi:hypothetical protein
MFANVVACSERLSFVNRFEHALARVAMEYNALLVDVFLAGIGRYKCGALQCSYGAALEATGAATYTE